MTSAKELPCKHQRLQNREDTVEANGRSVSPAMVGGRRRILVAGPSRKEQGGLMGRTWCNRKVNFKGAPRLVGSLIDVTVTQANPNSLRGEAVVA